MRFYTILAAVLASAAPAVFATPVAQGEQPPTPVKQLQARQSGGPCSSPGTFTCQGRAVMVCNSSRTWQLSALCGGNGCCRVSGASAFCNC
ncbi:hypothetical protein GGTG_11316 [Gaeumannomyces tritici R3-111a-1]|uniref:Uncharacterized protein n=1 Tax=Gaeumannomyces tritici (strain R3-111a-1) TaxID=644352 RepID=J3PCU7_GAET3|nr:hypothetical protein GGTG_11316 [Gaeumannomyces tritici R3-111a-1]EJT72068.1 hypothetical protein GGTG_11316 [Gaeumannomyces tritici R3-111a-1]